MKIKMTEYITEIEADARELRESNTLGANFAMMLSRAFQSREPFDDEEEEGEQDEQGNLLKGARIIVDYYYDVTVDDDYTDATLKQATAFIPAIQWKSSESINYNLSLANVTLITIDKPSIESWGAPQTGGTIIIK